MKTSKIEIHIELYGTGSTISVDGVQLPMVRAFAVRAEADVPSRVTVEFIATEVVISGDVLRRRLIAMDIDPDHAQLVAEGATHDVVQYEDGSFEVIAKG